MYEQYYTEQAIGKQLVKMLPRFKAERCVELSAGQGALLEPVLVRWPHVEITTCELDPANVKLLRDRFEGVHHKVDVLDAAFESVVLQFEGKFDLAVSNPPYCWKAPSLYDRELLESFGFQAMFEHKRLRAEVLFILQNIRLLREGGYAAFILPELIIRSDLLKRFRAKLSSICNIVALAEISPGEFKGTEAHTYILVVQKSAPKPGFLYMSMEGGKAYRTLVEFSNGLRVENIVDERYLDLFEIKRGNFSGKECKATGVAHYHTSGYFYSDVDVDECIGHLARRPVIAERGDILISRVGTRVLGNLTVVTGRNCIISDCIFRLRFSCVDLNDDFVSFWNEELNSLRSEARGTCAKYFTKDDLTFRVNKFLEEKEVLQASINLR